MEGKVILLAFLLSSPIIPFQSTSLLIYEVSPYPYSGTQLEYVCIVNAGDSPLKLSDYTLTDFEGSIELSGYLYPGEKYYVAQNASAFYSYFGFYPDLNYSSRFALSNSGDEVAIMRGNTIVDLVIYGDSNFSSEEWNGEPLKVSQGHILRRMGFVDTNTPEDWTNYHRVAQSDFREESFKANVELFSYPDNWREVLRFVKNAREEILIESYTLDSPEFVGALENKTKEGVSVQILLEGSPVGGMPEGEKFAVHSLWESGAKIGFMINEPEERVYNRYTYIHSKFIVVDSSEALISTENFGFSSLRDTGNRGYGVIVRNANFAHYLRSLFFEDFKKVADIEIYSGEFENASSRHEKFLEFRRPKIGTVNITAEITPLISPDFSEEVFWDFVDSQRTIYVEALYIDDHVWERIRNKTAVALVEGGNGNERFDGHKDGTNSLHAKLMLGDDEIIVGSMNFGISSMERNREVSLIIRGEEAREYFLEVLNYDLSLKDKGFLVVDRGMNGNVLKLSFQKSERIKRVKIYLDGKRIYQGAPRDLEVEIGPGNHDVLIMGEDFSGREFSLEFHVNVRVNYPWRAIVSLFIFAAFLYKLWKRR